MDYWWRQDTQQLVDSDEKVIYDAKTGWPVVVTEEMIDRAAAAYEFGVMPGDESEATPEEIRQMAERVLLAALTPPV